ncbi:MAG: DUF433 domain-containing protein [Proteobacteria bacterium]|nr:DUF433 domain-containing protein [Pseudomonadota bacterium]
METNWADHVTSDPQVLAGKPIVRGTRLAVDFILGLFASVWTQDQLLQEDCRSILRGRLRGAAGICAHWW